MTGFCLIASQLIAFVILHLPVGGSLQSCNGTPPGPSGVPLTGFLPLMGKYPWITFDKLLPEYPELLEVNLGEPVVIIQDYETLEKAFVDQGQAFTGRPPQFVTDYFSSGTDGQVRGIIAIEGPKWQQTREFAYNYFQSRLTAEDLDSVVIEQANNVVNAFKKANGSLDPEDYLYSANVNIVSYLLFGRTLEFLGTEYRTLTKGMFNTLATLAGSPLQSCPLLRKIPGSVFERVWSSVVYTVDEGRRLFENELQRHESTYSPDKIRDFTDAYLRHVKRGGMEYPLAFQNKDEFISSSLTLWSAGGERLPYTSATMYEFLRLGGNAPLSTPRATMEDTALDGYCIPNRTTVFPNIYSIHRNPKYWKDPLTFNPERFIGTDGKVLEIPQFISWSLGPRECPAKYLSNVTVFTLFANIMQRLKVNPAAGKPLAPFNEFQPGISNLPLPFEVSFLSRF